MKVLIRMLVHLIILAGAVSLVYTGVVAMTTNPSQDKTPLILVQTQAILQYFFAGVLLVFLASRYNLV